MSKNTSRRSIHSPRLPAEKRLEQTDTDRPNANFVMHPLQGLLSPVGPPPPPPPSMAWRSCKPMLWRVPPVGGSYRGGGLTNARIWLLLGVLLGPWDPLKPSLGTRSTKKPETKTAESETRTAESETRPESETETGKSETRLESATRTAESETQTDESETTARNSETGTGMFRKLADG